MSRKLTATLVLVAILLSTVAGIGPAMAASPGDVVINEIMQNPSAVSDGAGEWLELYNATGAEININGWTIADNDIDSHVINNGGPLVIPAGGFLVLGSNADQATNGGVLVAYSYGSSWFLANGADEVILLDGEGVEIDRVEYDGGPNFPDPTGASMSLVEPALDNNLGANWCTASTPFGGGDLGTPGAGNDCAPPAVEVFINEIQVSTTGTDWEFFELQGVPGTDLSGLTLVGIESDAGATAGTIDLVVDLNGQSIPSDGFWLGISPTGSSTYGVTGELSIGDNSFENSTATYLLVSGFAGAQGNDLDADNDGILDSMPWDAVLDAINIRDSAGDLNYGAPSVGPDGTFLPSGTFRCPDAPAGTFDENMLNFSTPDGTPGTANNCAGPALVINEIDYDQPSTDAAEFIEIRNNGSSAVDLGGFALELVNGTGGGASVYQTFNLPVVSLPAGDYFVVCANAATVANCDLDVSPDTNLVQNGAPDAVALVQGTAIIDAVSYEGDTGAPYTEGSGAGLEDSSSAADMGISRCPDGADTGQNNIDFAFTAITPGAANDCPGPELVINEIDYDQPSTDAAEFIEIRNNGSSAVDLGGFALELVNGTGGGASVYGTINLPVVSLPAGDYFVVCANAATVANCDLDVSPDTNLVQNGAPDAVALVQGTAIIDAVSYEGDTGAPYTEGSGAGLEDSSSAADMGISRCPDGTDTGQNNADFVFTGITPGAANSCEACGDPFTPIYEVQGAGLESPLVGVEVAVEGIVVGDFQNNGQPDNGDLDGFYIQDPAGDGDAATSDGVFVYAPGSMDVSVGDGVRVRGTVSEFFNLTEIAVGQVWQCSTGNSVTPTAVSLPVGSVNDLEAYEGMLVTFPQPLYISEYFNFDRFGEIVLATSRQFQPTAIHEPGSPEAEQLAQANLLSRITLDDGRGSQNPDPAIHPNGGVFDLTNLFRGGDTVQNVTGVMDYNFGLYRIQPTQVAAFSSANPRTAQPEDVGGNLKVASFNVLNYFTTLGSRGADTPEEFTRQRDKIFDALAKIDADVVGLIEIENNGTAVQNLVEGLNSLVGAGTYAYVDTGVVGADEITVAFIYKPASVSLVGGFAVLDDPSFTDPLGYGEQKSRPALAQTFMDDSTGGVFTVVVNHLKSKGTPCGEGDNDPEQGNCNLTRTLGAQALVDWLATDPTGSGDADFLIIGDLNAYDKEDPIDALVAGGYTDLLFSFLGENAYSYVFDGQLGYLDHALANPGLLDEVTGVTVWHINADEPDLIDYDMTFKQDAQDALYEPNAYRSSDHDPAIAGLSVCDEIAPTLVVTVTPDMLWPPNHKYVTVQATVSVSDNFDPNPVVELLSVTSNEPDNGLDDGDTPDDIVIVDDLTFDLRAERSGIGEGRIYTITYQATDACGNTTVATATVSVPLSKGEDK